MNYVNQYNKSHYDRLIVLVPKGSLERIRREALSNGVSASEFVRRMIPEHLLTKGENEDDRSGIEEERKFES